MTAVLDHDARRLDVARRALPAGSSDAFAFATMLRTLDGAGTAATASVAAAVEPLTCCGNPAHAARGDVNIPLLFTVDELVDFFAADYGRVTVDDVGTALHRVGRNYGPALLEGLLVEDVLTADVATAHVGPVWSMAEYPDAYLDRATWRELFELAGYTCDGVPAERPTEVFTLYRGSVSERRDHWSWTDDIAVARGYAQGTAARRPSDGVVWTAQVEPWRLLARNLNRSEAEYVVDTDGLLIRPAVTL